MLHQGVQAINPGPAPAGYMLRRRFRPVRTVTIRELCAKLDISLMTVHGWRAGSPCRRQLPSSVTKVGSANRVSLSADEITEWLAEYRPMPGGKDLYALWTSQT